MGGSSVTKVIPYTIFFIAVVSIQQFTSIQLGNTFIWWLIEALILSIYIWEVSFDSNNQFDKRIFRLIICLLLYNIFSLVRGIFFVESYWDVKNLVGHVFVLLLPIVVYLANDVFRVQAILSVFIKFAIPMFVFFLPFLTVGSWAWYLAPISFLVLFLPVLTNRWKIFLLLVALVLMFGDMSLRSNILKFGIPLLLLVFYYLRYIIVLPKVMNLLRRILLIAPFVFFFFAVSGTFNVFDLGSYLEGLKEINNVSIDDEGNERSENMATDTRTFLYEEVIHSALKHNYWFLGRSPARGNDTVAFADLAEVYGRKERPSNEVCILNVFTWTGLVGVLFSFLVFVRASFLAINRSLNIFSKLLGLFVAFHWLYSWVENANRFDISNFLIWLMIGLCFSTSFRQMNNSEVKLWARGIFEKKYCVVYRKYMFLSIS